jgi:hypothetical protein
MKFEQTVEYRKFEVSRRKEQLSYLIYLEESDANAADEFKFYDEAFGRGADAASSQAA